MAGNSTHGKNQVFILSYMHIFEELFYDHLLICITLYFNQYDEYKANRPASASVAKTTAAVHFSRIDRPYAQCSRDEAVSYITETVRSRDLKLRWITKVLRHGGSFPDIAEMIPMMLI